MERAELAETVREALCGGSAQCLAAGTQSRWPVFFGVVVSVYGHPSLCIYTQTHTRVTLTGTGWHGDVM